MLRWFLIAVGVYLLWRYLQAPAATSTQATTRAPRKPAAAVIYQALGGQLPSAGGDESRMRAWLDAGPYTEQVYYYEGE